MSDIDYGEFHMDKAANESRGEIMKGNSHTRRALIAGLAALALLGLAAAPSSVSSSNQKGSQRDVSGSTSRAASAVPSSRERARLHDLYVAPPGNTHSG